MSVTASPAHTKLPGARGLAGLAGEFTAARWHTRRSDGILAALAVIAFGVATAVANIVASGTWMFVQRHEHPRGLVAAVIAQDPTYELITGGYIMLAGLACALLVLPIIGLAISATLLGARSREERLATLRLLGMTRLEVSVLGFLEVMARVVAGIILGGVLTAALVPVFAGMEFQAMPVTVDEMLMPWWNYLVVAGVILVIAALASVVGLIRVQISPLGVARREGPKALRWWRLALLAGIVAVVWWLPRTDLMGDMDNKQAILAVIALLLAWGLVLDVAMPYMLQVTSRLIARSRSTTVAWAARRVVAHPEPTWRRVGGLSLLVFIASFFGQMPVGAVADAGSTEAQSLTDALLPDVRAGLILTIIFSFALTAVSAMVNQASAEFERAGETHSMLRMGVSGRRLLSVNWTEALGPLAGSVVLSLLVGKLFGTLLSAAPAAIDPATLEPLAGFRLVAGTTIAGFLLMVAALALTLPIHRRIVVDDRRR